MKNGLLFAAKSPNLFPHSSADRSTVDSRSRGRLPEIAKPLFLIALASTIYVGFTRYGLAQSRPASREPGRVEIARKFGSLPLSFEANHGQADGSVKFLARTKGYSLLLTENEATLRLANGERTPHEQTLLVDGAAQSINLPAVTMQLADSVRTARITGESQLPGKANYLTGNDPAQWHTDVPTYASVRYSGVYPGVDLVYYGTQKHVEYDFIVSPGADPAHIRFQFKGMNSMKLDKGGNLILSIKQGEIELLRPAIYQESGAGRRKVNGGFKLLAGHTAGFSLGHYDHSRELIIDPVLSYSTFLALNAPDPLNAIAVDSQGSAYVTGYEAGTDGRNQMFVVKLNPEGSALAYSTLLGDGTGYAIAVDAGGNAYVGGQGFGMPVSAGAFQPTGKSSGGDAYIAKVNPAGNGIVYGSYLGGSGIDLGGGEMQGAEDAIYSIAVDSSGNAFVAGIADSPDFPITPGAYLTTDLTPGEPFSFLAKINPAATALVYSTLLMGPGSFSGASIPIGQANGVAVDSSGNAYVVGETGDKEFPVTPGAFQTGYTTNTSDPQVFRYTGYVTKFGPTGANVVYSSYLGGGFLSSVQAVAVDSAGDAYVTGWSTGGIITTPGSFQPYSGSYDAFVAKINPSGSAYLYSTNLGGSCPGGPFLYGDSGNSIVIDGTGNAYVAGATCSTDFPLTTDAVETTRTSPTYDAFFSVLNSSGSTLLYSTYLGGSDYGGDWATAVALDSSGNAYVAGQTSSSDFPSTTGAYQTNGLGNGTSVGFISKFAIPQGSQYINRSFTLSVSPASATITRGQIATTVVTVAPANGFSQTITISCTGLPSWAFCSNISSIEIVPTSSALTSTIAVSTVPATSSSLVRPSTLATTAALSAFLFCFGFRRKWRGFRSWALVGFVLTTSLMNGCGGGSGGNGGGGSNANTFTVTITGTADTVVQTTTFTVTAN